MIIDSFLFNGEEQMLNFRLHHYDGVVDKFVIIESTLTILGEPKELTWPKMKDRFSKFESKIQYVQLNLEGEWPVREAGVLSIDCDDEDIVFHSDVDEIWNYKNLDTVKDLLVHHEAVRFTGEWYAYDIEHRIVNIDSFLSYAILGKNRFVNVNSYRGYKLKLPTAAEHKGWHLTWFGGLKQCVKKASSGLGSDFFRIIEYEDEEDIIDAVVDRFNKKRLPLLAGPQGRSLEYIPISENKNLPRCYDLL